MRRGSTSHLTNFTRIHVIHLYTGTYWKTERDARLSHITRCLSYFKRVQLHDPSAKTIARGDRFEASTLFRSILGYLSNKPWSSKHSCSTIQDPSLSGCSFQDPPYPVRPFTLGMSRQK